MTHKTQHAFMRPTIYGPNGLSALHTEFLSRALLSLKETDEKNDDGTQTKKKDEK